jgi:hypothetical protein
MGLDADFDSETLAYIEEEVGECADTAVGRRQRTTHARARRLQRRVARAENHEWFLEEIAGSLRLDLLNLVADVRRRHPGSAIIRPDCRPVLFLDDVHTFPQGFKDFHSMLGPVGLQALLKAEQNVDKLAVVMFTKESSRVQVDGYTWLTEALSNYRNATTKPVRLFRELAEDRGDGIDLLAWRWLLLHPIPEARDGRTTPFTVSDSGRFEDEVRRRLHRVTTAYPSVELAALAAAGRDQWLRANDDEAYLAACAGAWGAA